MVATGLEFGDELPYHEKKWSFTVDELQHILLETSSSSIEVSFVTSKDNNGYVEFRGNLEQENFDLLSEASISNGTLQLSLQQKRVIRFFHFQTGSNKRQFTIALPAGQQLDSFAVNMYSANGKFNQVQANQVEISSSSGRITINELMAEQLKLESSSGNIYANNVQANAIVSASSGNIEINKLAGEGKIETSSGNIEVTQLGTASLEVEARSGNVTIYPDKEFSGYYDLQSSSGNIKSLESKRLTTDYIKVRTTSGNIKIKE